MNLSEQHPPGSPARSSGRSQRNVCGLLLAHLLLRLAPAVFADAPPGDGESVFSPQELRGLSIEDLADLRITSAARRPENLKTTPAAVSVVTSEDIRRSASRNLPDALRLATGVHVARADNINSWAIGVRGFNFTTNNKLLVLRDGRSLYSPLFSGVFWDVQDTMLEDIDRIEVIRGPGATLWGANAVNGVISIMTKNAKETQGTLLTGGAGNRENGFAAARYGGRAGENSWYRVYARGWDRDDTFTADGRDSGERHRFGQGGFRIDSEPRPEIAWTVSGEIYDARTDRRAQDPIDLAGGHILGRWTHHYDRDHRLRIEGYYDRVERNIPDFFAEKRDTVNVEFDHRFHIGERHDLLWGATAQMSLDRVDDTPALAFDPGSRTVRQFSAFLQDQIALAPDVLNLTLGSKFEHNSYSGFEYQPSVRLAWIPEERQTVWAAVSRAVRTPSRIERDMIRYDDGSGFGTIRGDDHFRSERLVAYELGYRVRPTPPLTLDFALFYHDYDHLRSVEQAPVVFDNQLEGESYGGEVAAHLQLSEWWRLKLGYAHFQKQIRADSTSDDDPDLRGAEGNDPRHNLFVQSTLNLGEKWAFDNVVRHVSELPNPQVPAYTELDVRLAYRARENFEISLAGRNLLNPYRREFGTTHAVPRTLFFRVRLDL